MKDLEIPIGSKSGIRNPICPHCEKELQQINMHKGKMNVFQELQVYSCPHCRKVLKIQPSA